MDVRERVKQFIITELAQKDGGAATVTDGESLLDRGILDSLGVLRVLGFLEEEYKLTVGDDDVVPENFESIDAIVAFVQRRANGG